jgi:hypothetical protein
MIPPLVYTTARRCEGGREALRNKVYMVAVVFRDGQGVGWIALTVARDAKAEVGKQL